MSDKLGIGMGYDPSMSVRQLADWATRAEGAGAEIVFFSETIYSNRDSVSALSAFSMTTKSAQLGATQVVRLRTPLIMAQTAAALDEMCGGRLVLVLGACTHHHAARNALEPADPLVSLKEWVAAIRLLLTGDRVSFNGTYVKFEDVGLNWKPPRPDIPIWLAAAARPGLRTAGEIADGVLLDACCSPEYSKSARALIDEGASKAGRDLSDFTVAQLINTSIEDTEERARDRVRWEVASKFATSGPGKARLAVGDPTIREADLPQFEAAYEQGGMQGLIPRIPDSYVDAMTISGPLEKVRSRLAAYRRAGVQLPILRPAAGDQFGHLLDFVKEQRGQPA